MNLEEELKALLLSEADASIPLCRSLVRIPSEDPPGDTRDIAGFINGYFRSAGVSSEIIAPVEDLPNVVATVCGGLPGPHVVFNGHMDTFPAGDRKRWNHDPFGGEISEGRLYGRGAADMKGGLAASIVSVVLLNRIRDRLPGKVSITCVSNEEVFGPWGSQFLLKTRPEIRGDALINGEPSSLGNVRVGEKGQYWFRFQCKTGGGHGAYSSLKPSAILDLAKLLEALSEYAHMPLKVPANVREMMMEAKASYDELLCPGATEAALRPSVNIGTISGGMTVNMIAEQCTAEVDFRLPPGTSGEDLRQWIRKTANKFPNCSMEEFNSYDAFLTDPAEKLVRIARKTAEEVVQKPVHTTFSLGGTEARLWRQAGTPAITFGPNHHNMGSPDEYVEAEELPQVVRVHALTALRFLLQEGTD